MSVKKKLKARLELVSSQRDRILKSRQHIVTFALLEDPKTAGEVLATAKKHGPLTEDDLARHLNVPSFTLRPYILAHEWLGNILPVGSRKNKIHGVRKTIWRVPTFVSAQFERPPQNELARNKKFQTRLDELCVEYPKCIAQMRESHTEDDRQYLAERRRLLRELASIRVCNFCDEEYVQRRPYQFFCSDNCEASNQFPKKTSKVG